MRREYTVKWSISGRTARNAHASKKTRGHGQRLLQNTATIHLKGFICPLISPRTVGMAGWNVCWRRCYKHGETQHYSRLRTCRLQPWIDKRFSICYRYKNVDTACFSNVEPLVRRWDATRMQWHEVWGRSLGQRIEATPCVKLHANSFNTTTCNWRLQARTPCRQRHTKRWRRHGWRVIPEVLSPMWIASLLQCLYRTHPTCSLRSFDWLD